VVAVAVDVAEHVCVAHPGAATAVALIDQHDDSPGVGSTREEVELWLARSPPARSSAAVAPFDNRIPMT
jgi:hypothetical protein